MRRDLLIVTGAVIIAVLIAGSYLYLSSQSGGVYFVVDVLGERFTMLVVDQQSITEALDNMNGLNSMHPIGVLQFGDGGFNKPWSWHYKPETVRMTEISAEVCDAEPHFVQENLDYWVNTVQYYCPWSAKILSANQSPPSESTSLNQLLGIAERPVEFGNQIPQSLVNPLSVGPPAYTSGSR
jgi:hypothetical protein